MSFRSGFIAVIGKPNVGKSTLVNAFVKEKVAIVSNRPQTTRNRVMGIANGDGWQMVFLDTPGLHTPRTKLGEYMVKSARSALEGVDALVVMLDAAAISAHDKAIIGEFADLPIKKTLVVNKIDLVTPQVLMPLLNTLHGLRYDEIVPASAVRGDNMERLHTLLLSYLPEGPVYFPDDMITDQPVRLLCADIIREKALRLLREEVPHGIGVEMQAITKVSENLTEIHATIYCEKAAHKRIVIGKNGEMLGRIGTQARSDIERLLGTKVMLKTWVKVREDWRNRPDDLRTLGYEDH